MQLMADVSPQTREVKRSGATYIKIWNKKTANQEFYTQQLEKWRQNKNVSQKTKNWKNALLAVLPINKVTQSSNMNP